MLLLAAMASGAIYTAFWLVIGFVLSTTNQNLISSNTFGVYILVLLALYLWGSATLVYHIEYMLSCRRAQRRADAEEAKAGAHYTIVETHYIIWDDGWFFLIKFLVWLLWIGFRYLILPMALPILVILTVLDVPVVGTALGIVCFFAIILYPFICLTVYAVRYHKPHIKGAVKGAK